MFSQTPLSSLVLAALLGLAQATYLNNDISFGHIHGNISPNFRGIPNFHLMGKPDPPEILSNKVVLTAPAPGNQRGAIWAEKPMLHSWWTVDVDFRATGPERGGGNFNIWYTHKGREDVGTSSIYTVGRFDGFVLVVDQYGGSGGFIRGFLNDGSTDFKSHHSVDSLAFGHCNYAYRNLGRPSRIAIRQSKDTFRVNVDGHLCFESKKVKLPLGYLFGLTAASAENPDSFEVFKFVTTTDSHTPDVQDSGSNQDQFHAAAAAFAGSDSNSNGKSNPNTSPNNGAIPSFSDPPDTDAKEFHTTEAQFADLHNRLQSMMKHIGSLNRDFSQYKTAAQSRLETLTAQLTRMESSISRLDHLSAMDTKLDTVMRDVRQTKSDLHDSLDRHVAGLKSAVREGHQSLLGTVAESAPRVGMFVFVVVAGQAALVAAFLLYKRRKAGGMKKFL